MQSSFRSKTQNQIKDFFYQESFENTPGGFDLISPWNITNAHPKNNIFNTLKNHKDQEKFNINKLKYQSQKTSKSKFQRVKTQSSKYNGKKYLQIPFGKDDFFINLFSKTQTIQTKQGDKVNLKKGKKQAFRQKFKTPIVNLNEYTFDQTHHKPLIQKSPKFRFTQKSILIRQKAISPSRFYFKQSYISKPKKSYIKKNLTQKIIPFHKAWQLSQLSVNVSASETKQLKDYKLGNISLMQNIKRLTSSSIMQPVVKNLKSRSMNKFSKTFYQ